MTSSQQSGTSGKPSFEPKKSDGLPKSHGAAKGNAGKGAPGSGNEAADAVEENANPSDVIEKSNAAAP
jgi:hypothetical protein